MSHNHYAQTALKTVKYMFVVSLMEASSYSRVHLGRFSCDPIFPIAVPNFRGYCGNPSLRGCGFHFDERIEALHFKNHIPFPIALVLDNETGIVIVRLSGPTVSQLYVLFVFLETVKQLPE
jgi:hypothetical protein